MVAKKRRGNSWRPFWSWLAYVFIAAVGLIFLVMGFWEQSNGELMPAFFEYFIGIILLGSSIKKVRYGS